VGKPVEDVSMGPYGANNGYVSPENLKLIFDMAKNDKDLQWSTGVSIWS